MSDPAVDPKKSPLPQDTIPPTFEIKVGDETRKVKMVFGKLNRICVIVGDLANVQQLLVDPVVSAQVMTELLSTKEKPLKVEDIDEMDISPEDAAAFVTWAGTHVLDFFIKLGENFSKQATPLLSKMQKVVESSEAAVAAATPPTSSNAS